MSVINNQTDTMKLTRQQTESYIYDTLGHDKCDAYKVGYDYYCIYFKDKKFTLTNCYEYKKWLCNLVSGRTGHKMSNYTINNYLKTLKLIIKAAVFNKMLEEDFGKFIPLLKTEPIHRDILEVEEMKRFMAVAYNKSYRKAVCIEAFLKSGCRPDELFMAQWKNLHNDLLYITDTKTNDPRDVIMLEDLLEKILKLDHHPHNYIFGGPRGKIDKRKFNIFIRQCLVEAGINKTIRTVELRHSYATMLAEMHVSHFFIRDLLGHKNIITTQRYIHMSRRMKKDIAKQLPLSEVLMTLQERIDKTRAIVDEFRTRKCEALYEIQLDYAIIKIPLK